MSQAAAAAKTPTPAAPLAAAVAAEDAPRMAAKALVVAAPAGVSHCQQVRKQICRRASRTMITGVPKLPSLPRQSPKREAGLMAGHLAARSIRQVKLWQERLLHEHVCLSGRSFLRTKMTRA